MMHKIQFSVAQFVCAAVLCYTAVASAQADVASDAAKLLRAGQTEQAAVKVESGLTVYPKDAQLRFLRGVIQIEQRKNSDAINTFLRLIEDYPELPEPYNNLAVLYGGLGQYDKARAALELAIRTHPSYATAHENLGDVYTKLAGESYGRALQLDSANNVAQFKLSVIKDLSSGKPTKPTPPPSIIASAAVVPQAIPVAVAPPAPAVVSRPAPVVAAAPVTAPIAAPNTAPIAASSSQPSSSSANSEKDEVLAAVKRWAKAWSNRDVEGYLAMYGKAFAVPGGESRKAWEQERRSRIEGKKSISVGIDTPTVTIEGSTATVKFRQSYQADSLDTTTRKTLNLQKVGNDWKIIAEQAGR